MKRSLLLLLGGVFAVWLSSARAGDVKIKATMATSPKGESTTSFAANTPKLYCMFQTEGLSSGDKIRGVWIADDVGEAAEKHTKIDEKTITADGDTDDGVFSLSKPTKGWPPGKYRVEIYVGDDLVTTAKFSIAAAKSKKSDDDDSSND
jgi:hypothetical protein